MRKYLVTLISLFIISASISLAHASNVGFNIGINLGNLPVPVIVAPPVEVAEPPEFVAGPGFGFYMAVDTSYDLFYADNRYYLCRGDSWYAAPYYSGPWARVGYRALPWRLRRYPLARLRGFRNDWSRHRGDVSYWEYGHFRPERHEGYDRRARWEEGMHERMMDR